jgi:signal transduction histidine kinase
VRNWDGFRVDKYGRAFPVLVTAFPLVRELRDGIGGNLAAMLRSMQERVEIIGGSFSVHSLFGAGTRIRITLPMSEDKPI